MFTCPTDAEKAAMWSAYRERAPSRVPLRWNTNPRIILLNPALNPEGWTFEQYFNEPPVTLKVQARYQEHLAIALNRTCDSPCALPEEWSFRVDCQNAYDGAYFGGSVQFEPGQCPSNVPVYTADDVDAFLACDWSRPLENEWLKERLLFHERLVREARTFRYAGRKGNVAPFALGFDGPVTVAAVLFGADAFYLLGAEPDKARKLFETLTRGALARLQALGDLNGGWKKGQEGWFADDSIQLISPEMYERYVLPVHELWYSSASDSTPASGTRFIHLCGDATRHFKTIAEKLGVVSFDTGYPVDHGALRRVLGPAIEISGGARVDVLRRGTPDDCAAATKEILGSGIMAGGRFVLQEANNLPPCCPLENLQAVYEACRTYGAYA